MGKGEFGSVFKAYDKTLEQCVAIKCLQINPENESQELYLNEAYVLKKLYELKPKVFLKYYDTFKNTMENPPTLMISMKAAEASLANIMKYRQKYSDPEIIYIVQSLVKALFLAKKQGISHGDIKLADVVFFKRNKKMTYKLIDFGFSIMVSELKKIHDETNEEIKGFRIKGLTPNYAAPELLDLFSDNYPDWDLVNVFKMDI